MPRDAPRKSPEDRFDVIVNVRLNGGQRDWVTELAEALQTSTGGAIRHLVDQAMATDPAHHRRQAQLERLLDEQHPGWRDELAGASGDR